MSPHTILYPFITIVVSASHIYYSRESYFGTRLFPFLLSLFCPHHTPLLHISLQSHVSLIFLISRLFAFLKFILLHCTVLYYSTPYFTPLHSPSLHYTVPHHTAFPSPPLNSTTLPTTPHHITSHHTTPHHTTPHNITPRHTI